MKNVFFLLILSLIVASCEKEPNETMTVVINCTGIYLRQDGKDYHVCNIEKLPRMKIAGPKSLINDLIPLRAPIRGETIWYLEALRIYLQIIS